MYYLPDDLRPTLPVADSPESATAILQEVLSSTLALHDNLSELAKAHNPSAPTSSRYVQELDARLARAVLEWIERWPS